MTNITHGCETTIANQAPTVHWQASREIRDEAIKLVAESLARNAENKQVLMRRLIRLEDGSVYAEEGPPALHVQWRRTRFRADDSEHHAYQDQLALVNVINGHVFIVDPKKPFKLAQYSDWSRNQCLQEYIPHSARKDSTGVSFWPKVRPAEATERCHYVVINPTDLATLQTRSRPEDYFESVGPYRVPTFA